MFTKTGKKLFILGVPFISLSRASNYKQGFQFLTPCSFLAFLTSPQRPHTATFIFASYMLNRMDNVSSKISKYVEI